MSERNTVVKYVVETYYGGNAEKVAQLTGRTKKQVEEWISGERQPNKDTVEYIIHCTFTPEFTVIVE
jgi:3'-phosphoadenosine 5'-phosphosulfate sulfotransferase